MATKNDKKYHRIILDLSNGQHDKISELQEMTGVKNRSEFIRMILGIISTILTYAKDGYEIKMVKKDSTVVLALPLIKL